MPGTLFGFFYWKDTFSAQSVVRSFPFRRLLVELLHRIELSNQIEATRRRIDRSSGIIYPAGPTATIHVDPLCRTASTTQHRLAGDRPPNVRNPAMVTKRGCPFSSSYQHTTSVSCHISMQIKALLTDYPLAHHATTYDAIHY